MAEGMNRWIGLGNLGADPELRFTQNATAVLNLRLACNERRKDRDGNWSDHVEWVSVVLWGKRAEALGKILRKGSSIMVEGSLRTSDYEARDGSGKRYKTEVNARNVILCGGKGDGGQREQRPAGPAPSGGHAPDPGFPDDEDCGF